MADLAPGIWYGLGSRSLVEHCLCLCRRLMMALVGIGSACGRLLSDESCHTVRPRCAQRVNTMWSISSWTRPAAWTERWALARLPRRAGAYEVMVGWLYGRVFVGNGTGDLGGAGGQGGWKP